MTDAFTTYLAVCVVTDNEVATLRLGHFIGWLFDESQYDLIQQFGTVKEAKRRDYDTARAFAVALADEMDLPFVDAVSQHGTQKKASILKRARDKAVIALLKQATKRVTALSKHLQEQRDK